MFAEIKKGFLVGVGFSIALFLAFMVMYMIAMSAFDDWEDEYDEGDYVEFDDKTKLSPSILSHEVNQDIATLLGMVVNDTQYAWEETSLEIEFYSGETFVRECSEVIGSIIKPGTKENFEIACKTCGDAFPEFDRIEVKINDSWKSE